MGVAVPSCVICVSGTGRTRLLSELVGVLAHRLVDVTSINAAFDDSVCRVQLSVATTDPAAIDMLLKRINRIVGVAKVVVLTDDVAHHRSATLVTVSAVAGADRSQLLELAGAFGAEIVEVAAKTVTLSFAGTPRREREFLDLVEPFGVAEIAQSGAIGVRRARRPASRPNAVASLSVVSA
ncbi:acetolactate synthase small subunit [Dactylosporangium sp. CA-233914]|uniref:acetolactate synthase small subunit n=1 Tax=Dactylosporangium sp. CA-233914 TaxID=3239934 RepID=UPI003D928563